jgi:hypothetical protein
LNGFNHPGGQYILSKVRGKDIDKYLCGAASI